MSSFKNVYEKTSSDQNAIWYRLWLEQIMKRLGKISNVHDPDLDPIVKTGAFLFLVKKISRRVFLKAPYPLCELKIDHKIDPRHKRGPEPGCKWTLQT